MRLTRRSCWGALGLLLIGCGAAAVLPAPEAQPSPALASSNVTRLPAPPPPPGEVRAATPVQRQPAPPAGSEGVALWLGNVCQLASLPEAEPGSPTYGCGCCAPFAECPPGRAGEAVEAVFAPSAHVAGAFTRAGADELALTMPGCEPHSENFGGLLLLERGQVGFAMTRYVSGLNASECWAVRRDDERDLLLCQRGEVHQGTAHERLFLWDLSQSDEQLLAAEEVFSVSDNSLSGCWSPVGTPVSAAHLDRPELQKRAGHVELAFQLDVRAGRVTQAYLARCSALEQAEDAATARALPSPTALLARSSARLTFRFDGTTFVRRR